MGAFLLIAVSANCQRSPDYWKINYIRQKLGASEKPMQDYQHQQKPGTGAYFLVKGLSISYDSLEATVAYMQQAEKAFRKEGLPCDEHQARAYYANFLLFKSKYDQSLGMLQDEMEYAVQNNCDYLHFYTNYVIGKTYYLLENQDLSLQYLNKAQNLLIEYQHEELLPFVYYMKTAVYESLLYKGKDISVEKTLAMVDSTLSYAQKYDLACLTAKTLVLKSSLKESEATVDELLQLLDSAIAITLQEECTGVLQFALTNKARTLFSFKKSYEGIHHLEEMLKHGDTDNANYYAWIYSLLAKAYAGQEEWQKAYQAIDSSKNYYLDIFNARNAESAAEQDARYRTLENKLENERLENSLRKEKHRQERMTVIFIFVTLFLIVISIAVWIIYKHRAKRKEQQLMTRSLVEGEQKERIRIAQDIHDGLGQVLSSVRLNVAALEGEVKPEDEEILETSITLLDKSIREIREISHNLMPSDLIRLGLLPALQELARKVNTAGKVMVNIQSPENMARLSSTREIAIYRVIQEVLNNMIRHAGASKINIVLEEVKSRLFLTLEDNGKGFDVEKAKNSSGIGWKNIYSRVELLNGTVKLHSQKDRGTRVSIQIPVADEG